MNKILCIGEALLRFVPTLTRTWITETFMETHIGGAELNVVRALALWGLPVRYFTAMPPHQLSEDIVEQLQSEGIDTSQIVYANGRLGTYYLPKGTGIKKGNVIYDRSHSSFASLKTNDIQWDKLFEDVGWLHLSAITPAISRPLAELSIEATRQAKLRSLTISIDLNYRESLWQKNYRPRDVMHSIVQHCDVVMGNPWAMHHLLDIPLDQASLDNTDYKSLALHSLHSFQQRHPNCSMIAFSFRIENEHEMNYQAMISDVQRQYWSARTKVDPIIDKVGSGDAFMAALIYGIIHNEKPQDLVSLCAASAITKLQQKGDHIQSSIKDIYTFHRSFVVQ